MLRPVLAAALCALALLPPATAAAAGSGVLVAFLPPAERAVEEDAPAQPTVLERLDRREELSLGLMGATQGAYRREQALLDMTQGTRVSRSAYEPRGVPELGFVLTGEGARVLDWRLAVARARSAGSRIVPGLLASSVPGGAAYAGVWSRAQKGAIVAADRRGRVAAASIGSVGTVARRVRALLDRHRLVVAGLPPAPAGTRALDELLAARRQAELVIVIREPPDTLAPQLLATGIAGLPGGPGLLTSVTTRRDGLIAGIDLLPTVLGHLGVPIPAGVKGQPIEIDGTRDAGALRGLESRLRVLASRRFAALELLLLTWGVLMASLAASRGRAGTRAGLRIGGLGIFWLPSVVLLTAAVGPPRHAELITIAVLPLLLGWLTDLAVRWPRAPLVPAAAGLTLYAADLALGSPLIVQSLLGPNPRFGSRYYGLGNELEATLPILLLIGVAAALYGRPRSREAAAVFALSGLGLGVLTGAGWLGADVGGVITVGAGTAVATLLMLPGRLTASRLAVAAAVPALALVGLAAIDLASGGNSHFTRTILRAEDTGSLIEVLGRRYELAWAQLGRGLMPAATAAAIVLSVWGVARYGRIYAPLGGDSAWRAALAGGLAGSIAGALFNDSGPVLLVLGVFALLFATLYVAGRPAGIAASR